MSSVLRRRNVWKGERYPMPPRNMHHSPAETLNQKGSINLLLPDLRHQYVYTENGNLCIENRAGIPLRRCIKTNDFADVVVKVPLRHPLKPSTWTGSSPTMKVGLSWQSFQRYSLAQRLFRAGQILTTTVVGLSFYAGNWGVLAAAAIVFCALLSARAIGPVRSIEVKRSFSKVSGFAAAFLQQFDCGRIGNTAALHQMRAGRAKQGETKAAA